MKAEEYLISVSCVYLVSGMVNIFVWKFAPMEVLVIVYITVIGAPLVWPWLSKKVGIRTLW